MLRKVQNTGYLVPQISVHFVGLLGEKIPKKKEIINFHEETLKNLPKWQENNFRVDLISFHPNLISQKILIVTHKLKSY